MNVLTASCGSFEVLATRAAVRAVSASRSDDKASAVVATKTPMHATNNGSKRANSTVA
jgi:hypothetical protein